MKRVPVEAGMNLDEQQSKKWREPELKNQGLNQPQPYSGDTHNTAAYLKVQIRKKMPKRLRAD